MALLESKVPSARRRDIVTRAFAFPGSTIAIPRLRDKGLLAVAKKTALVVVIPGGMSDCAPKPPCASPALKVNVSKTVSPVSPGAGIPSAKAAVDRRQRHRSVNVSRRIGVPFRNHHL